MQQAKKNRLLVVCPHPENLAPGQRLKYEQYFSFFRENGFEVTVWPFMTNEFQKVVYTKGRIVEKIFWTSFGYLRRVIQLFKLRKYDVTYIFLWVTPFGPPFFEWLYCKLSKKIIYDIDDLVFLGVKSSANKTRVNLKGKNKPIFLMKHADHVITCTPYLDNIARKYNPHTTDISSTINTDTYRPKSDYGITDRPVLLGWSGSHSTSKYLHLLDPVFRKLKADGLHFKLLVMGDPDFKIEGIEMEAIPWKESYEVEIIRSFDIGLYPIPDEQWVYGKSGLKALQYMAAGVPTIASAIGTNFRIIEDGKNGFLAKNEEEWAFYLHKLSEDETLRKKIGMAGARLVEERYSIQANKGTYLAIIKSVLHKTKTVD
jgi:L-malate glycosyltransferase